MTTYRSLGPEDVAAPAPDAVLFRDSVPRALFILVPTVVAGWTLMALLLSAPSGHGVGWDHLGSLPLPVAAALAGFGGAAWRLRGRPTWIRVSALGIELAQRGDPVFVAWPQIASARVRGRWIFAALEVIPVDLYAVGCALPSRDLPRIRYTRGVAVFRVEAGTMRPGLSALRAVLARHRPPQGDAGDR